MPNVSISIGGQSVIVPGVYYNDQVIPVVPSGQQPTGPLIFLAQGYGGVPFTAKSYTDPNALLAAMRGAPSSDFVNFMFVPSTELNGASFVTYINVSPNTQSSATIQSSGVAASGIINLVSNDYGAPSNLLQYSVSNGSATAAVSGVQGKKIIIYDGFSGAVATGDNLGTPFQLAYVGASSGVTYSVTSAIAGKATTLTITSPVAGESLTLDLTTQTFSTMSQVIQQINGSGHYVAIGLTGNGAMPASALDIATNVSLGPPLLGVTNQWAYVTAYLGEVTWWLNNSTPSLATATIASNITSGPQFQLANTSGFTYFTGATNNVASLGNYASGFTAALNQLAWVVFADSGNAGVQALGAQHALTASNVVYRSWRRFVTGSALGESATTAQTNARNLNEFEATYVWPGIQRTNNFTGLNQTYDGLHTAAAVAGLMCGNPVTTPITNKTLIGNGIESITDLATKIDLQSNGVLVLDFTTQVRIPTFLSDVTCWQNDSSPANVFNQEVACRFALAYYITQQLQPYVGTIASNFTIGQAGNRVKVLLNALIYSGVNSIGILNSWDPATLVLTYNGSQQSLTVNVSVVLVGQIRFIPVTVTILPLNIISVGGQIVNPTNL